MRAASFNSCWLYLALVAVPLWTTGHVAEAQPTANTATKYLRFQHGDTVAFGIVEGNRVRQLRGDLFAKWEKTDQTYDLAEITFLPPTHPRQVLALAGNYQSHVAGSSLDSDTIQIPQPFFKSPSCLVAHNQQIVLPSDAKVVHYEAELVVVIGKTCRKVSKADALSYVFGLTVGNDVSERIWQNDEEVKDVQWWRAKGADTFGPVGPFIATGLESDQLMLTLRLNGEVRQQERTDHMIHDVASAVSFISQYVTMHPGDLIFTGTPGKTDTIKEGDIVEVELEGVGVLRNTVVRAP